MPIPALATGDWLGSRFAKNICQFPPSGEAAQTISPFAFILTMSVSPPVYPSSYELFVI